MRACVPGLRGGFCGELRHRPGLVGILWGEDTQLTRFPGHQEHLGNASGAARRAGPDRGATSSAAASFRGIMMPSLDHWHVPVALPPACPASK
jgi:hypothetical protein